MNFFSKKSQSVKSKNDSKVVSNGVPSSRSSHALAQSSPTVIRPTEPLQLSSASATAVLDGQSPMSEGAVTGPMSRLDSFNNADMGDLSCSGSSTVDPSHSAPRIKGSWTSQLWKTLTQVLADKDALAYLIQFLESKGSVNLVKFWLDAKTFRLLNDAPPSFPENSAASSSTPAAVGSSAAVTRAADSSAAVSRAAASNSLSAVCATTVPPSSSSARATSNVGASNSAGLLTSANNSVPIPSPSNAVLVKDFESSSQSNCDRNVENRDIILSNIASSDPLGTSARLPQQNESETKCNRRLVENSSSDSSLLKTDVIQRLSGISIAAHGDCGRKGENGAGGFSAGMGTGNACAGVVQSGTRIGIGVGETSAGKEEQGISSGGTTSCADTSKRETDVLTSVNDSRNVPRVNIGDDSSSEKSNVTVEDAGNELRDDKSSDHSTVNTLVSAEKSVKSHLNEKSSKSHVERDAVVIFSKYLSPDCSHPITISEPLRAETIRRICGEDGRVDPKCFVECQRAVHDIINTHYFNDFLWSVYHTKHQVDLLTGPHQLHLTDILYHNTSLGYFTEVTSYIHLLRMNYTHSFMESENLLPVLQCFIDLDNFEKHLLSQIAVSQQNSAIQGRRSSENNVDEYNAAEAQSDAIVIYEKYFSLQATNTSVKFDDKVRFEIENQICREEGPLPNCFGLPRALIYSRMEQTYFPRFLRSEQYYKYMSDLINAVRQAPDDLIPVHRKRTGSDASSERSFGSQHSSSIGAGINTLLATDTRGHHMKQVVSKVSNEVNMRMDDAMFNPDNLWKRQQPGKLNVGRVDDLGQFISEFDPAPDLDKPDFGRFFSKKKLKERENEEMALQVAQKIISDITSAAGGGDEDFDSALDWSAT